MSKRKTSTHRTPGTLSPFVGGAEAAERLAALGVITDRFTDWEEREMTERNGPPVAERPEPLRELSALVGIEVADVVRLSVMRHKSGPGVHQPKAWELVLAAGRRSLSFTTNDLHREDRLNEVSVTHWRRPLGMPRLTSDDGRRIVRLLHEVIENREAAYAQAHADTNTTTNGVDR